MQKTNSKPDGFLGKALLCLLATFLAACGAEHQAGERAVQEFRRLANAQHYEEIYTEASPELKQTTNKEAFVAFLTSVNDKLGSWKSSGPPQWRAIADSKGGKRLTIRYDSSFALGSATEEFIFSIRDGSVALLGYHLSSPLLSTGSKP
jgi:Protein of unknown function (DUF4019)